MTENTKDPLVRIVIIGVPESHVRMLKIKAATEGHHSLTGLMRKIIRNVCEEWERKQRNNKEVR